LGREHPELVDTLLSATASAEELGQAKLDAMRYLATERSGWVQAYSEVGSGGLKYAVAERATGLTLRMSEMPSDDPILGDAMKFFRETELYDRTLRAAGFNGWNEMTTDRIERVIRGLPEWAKEKAFGGDAGAGNAAWRVFRLLEKVGYKGNGAQQLAGVYDTMTLSLTGFSSNLRRRILKTVTDGISTQEAGLDPKEVDQLFRDQYALASGKPAPADLSITKIVTENIPLEEAGIKR
jgi:hypothetical protein